MGFLKEAWGWLLAKDPTLTPDQRLSRWVNVGTAGTVVWSISGGFLGSLINYPWAGVGIALALWVGFLNVVAKLSTQEQSRVAATIVRADSEELEQLTTKLREVEQERGELREELDKLDLQRERRRRIEEWQFDVEAFNFETRNFVSTPTYIQMKPHLRPEVIELFERPKTIIINTARGKTPYQYTLLDEIARIEKEWDLI